MDEHKLGWRREVYGWGKLKQSLTDLDTLEVFFFFQNKIIKEGETAERKIRE